MFNTVWTVVAIIIMVATVAAIIADWKYTPNQHKKEVLVVAIIMVVTMTGIAIFPWLIY